MGEQGEQGRPGSTSWIIRRAAMMSGMGMALCNCGAKEPPHNFDCPVAVAGAQMSVILKEELRKKRERFRP